MKKHVAQLSKKSFFRTIPFIKDGQVRSELVRAHLLIALLCFGLLINMIMALQPNYEPSVGLTVTAAALIVIVGVFSLSVAISLSLRRK